MARRVPVCIGVSGWTYDEWQGRFYPKELAKRRWLEYASRQFNSLEINASFYSLQRPDTYRSWYEATPGGFVFAVKGSRFITHNKKLSDVETPLANFFASGVLLLRDKLGPFVWQIGPNLSFDEERIESFLSLLPKDTEAAARLARRHDERLKGRSWTRADGRHLLRHAIEIRHPSYFNSTLVRIARRHGVAIVGSQSSEWPYTEELTTGFVYLRLHGPRKLYASAYDDRYLERLAMRIREWTLGEEPKDAAKLTDRDPPRRKNREVYVYFDNDQGARAPRNARTLSELLEEKH